MGVLVAFGDDANFVLSVGGFHPRFNPPPLPFPSPRRIAVDILNTDYARIRVRGLLRRHDEHGAVRGLGRSVLRLRRASTSQGNFGFDALFQFSPFHFIISISAAFSRQGLRHRDVRDSAPTSRSKGRRRGAHTARLDLAAVLRHRRRLRHHLGRRRSDTTLPPIAGHAARQGGAREARELAAHLPAGRNNLLVSLRKLDPAADDARAAPGRRRCASASACVPLDETIDKVGEPEAERRESVQRSTRAAGALAKSRRRGRVVRAGAVPRLRRRCQALASLHMPRATVASSCPAPSGATPLRRRRSSGSSATS